jgi:hypothetical protein
MTQAQRDLAIRRLESLKLRLNALNGMLKTELSSPFYRKECDQMVIETTTEIEAIEKQLATKLEFLFNFKGGGWNSEVAFTKEQAIEQAIANYGFPHEGEKILNIDITSFRVSTPDDRRNLLSLFD